MEELINKLPVINGYELFVTGAVLFFIIGLYGILQQSLVALKKAKQSLKARFL